MSKKVFTMRGGGGRFAQNFTVWSTTNRVFLLTPFPMNTTSMRDNKQLFLLNSGIPSAKLYYIKNYSRVQWSFCFFCEKFKYSESIIKAFCAHFIMCSLEINNFRYSWCHENGSFSVQTFNQHYLPIPQYTGS